MKKNINIQLEVQLWQEAKSEAAKNGKSLRDFVSEAIFQAILLSQRNKIIKDFNLPPDSVTK